MIQAPEVCGLLGAGQHSFCFAPGVMLDTLAGAHALPIGVGLQRDPGLLVAGQGFSVPLMECLSFKLRWLAWCGSGLLCALEASAGITRAGKGHQWQQGKNWMGPEPMTSRVAEKLTL
jgi:hypothetical protein